MFNQVEQRIIQNQQEAELGPFGEHRRWRGISLEDFAAAMLDEAERPRHHRERFTVAY